jgi:Icc-related predicted phosphoesterase
MSSTIVKIAFASDLHLTPQSAEYRKEFLADGLAPEILVLASDISHGFTTIEMVHEIAARYPGPEIVLIAGNHEFYSHIPRPEMISRLRDAFKDNHRIHFLENDRVEIKGLTFLGCTLWSDFSLLGEPELAMAQAQRHVRDFSVINERFRVPFHPKDCERLFRESYEFLTQNLADCDPARTVVVTHFGPGLETQNRNFEIASISAYFQANVAYLIDCYQPALWIYGHNHDSRDFVLGETRIVSNQLGYSSEPESVTGFDPNKIIEMVVD